MLAASVIRMVPTVCMLGMIASACTSMEPSGLVDEGIDLRDVKGDEGLRDGGSDQGSRDVGEDSGNGGGDDADASDIPVYQPCDADEGCPTGFICRTVLGSDDDPRRCVPGPDLLCAPCLKDQDCRPAGVATADRCLGTDAVGRFCGTDCLVGAGCPVGYQCVRPEGSPVSVKQCMPADAAECQCPLAAVQRSMATVCGKTNAVATCKGQRLCTEDGLTLCDAVDAAEETCNGIDDDCNGDTDEGVVFEDCARQWGGLMCFGPKVCENGAPNCKAGPPVTETCNGVDDDCDGDIDEDGTPDCVSVWKDEDRDVYGAGEPRCGCGLKAPWDAKVGGDCDDTTDQISPVVTEVCNGIDDNCDGRTDPPDLPNCVVAYVDMDGDLYGDPATIRCSCGSDTLPLVPDGTDCDDANDQVHPGMIEVCNELDDDCDGLTDDGPDRGGCEIYRADLDLDGFGSLVDGPCLCHADGEWVTKEGGDCADDDFDRKPGAAEVCNDLDDDCDTLTDEDFDCDPGTEGTEHCGLCGSRSRICGSDCMWPTEWSECVEAGTCQPGTLQTCSEGCGNYVCSEGCEWPTACTWTLDAYEPNDTIDASRFFGYYDEPYDPPAATGWIHGPDDIDWYSFRGYEEDTFPFPDLDSSMYVAVSLTGGDGNHRLCLLWDEGSTGVIDENNCVEGTGSLFVESSNLESGSFLSLVSGTISVSVSGEPSCTPYTMTWYWN